MKKVPDTFFACFSRPKNFSDPPVDNWGGGGLKPNQLEVSPGRPGANQIQPSRLSPSCTKGRSMPLHTSSLRPRFVVSSLAALATVVLAAATPAKASPIVIDNFTTAGSVSIAPTTASNPGSDSVTNSGTFGGLIDRTLFVDILQLSSSRGLRSASLTIGSGTATATITNNGAGAGSQSQSRGAIISYGDFVTPVDLTAGGNDRLRVVVGSTVPSGTLFKRYFAAASVGGGFADVFVGEWIANETYEIPFSAFTGVDFSQVAGLTVGMKNDVDIPGGTAYNNTLTLTSISAVPEPQTLALLGTAGAAIVGGLIRRRRRNGS